MAMNTRSEIRRRLQEPGRSLFAGACCVVFAGLISVCAHSSEVAQAARSGDVMALRALVQSGADVNEPQADGASALHWTAYAGDGPATELLLDAGADPQSRNREGMSPLLLAAMSGNADVLRMLLDAGAPIDERGPNGETALMMAARTGQPDALRVLIDAGAQLEATEALRGTTALMWAAASSNAEAVRVLLESGADPGAASAVTGPGRRPYLAPTAQSRIADYYRSDTQEDEPAAAADEDDFVTDRVSFDEAVAQLTEQARENAERLRASIEEGQDDGVEGRGGGDADQTEGGLTALAFAAREGDIDSVRALIEAGADVNQTTAYGWTALLIATQNRYYRIGRLLLENGADPNIQNDGGWYPLYIATDNRNIEGGDYPTRLPDMAHLDFIMLLLDYGADTNLRMKSSTETRTIFTHQWLYEEGATPFLRAAQSSDTQLMRLLLEHGADPHAATDAGVTPLMVAAGIGWVEGVTYEWSEEQNIETIRMLLDLGADVNARANARGDGRTALMGAAHKGRTEVVRILAEHGADLGAKDIGSRDSIHKLLGQTWQAIDYADGLVRVGVQSAMSHPQTAQLLRELMLDAGLEVPPQGRTLDSICVTQLCQ